MLTGNKQFDTLLLTVAECKTVARSKEYKICPARKAVTVRPASRLALVSLAYTPGGAFHPVNKTTVRVAEGHRFSRAYIGKCKGVSVTPTYLMLLSHATINGMLAIRERRSWLTGDPCQRPVNTNERRLHTGQDLKREGNPSRMCLGGLSLTSGSPTGYNLTQNKKARRENEDNKKMAERKQGGVAPGDANAATRRLRCDDDCRRSDDFAFACSVLL